MTKPWIALSRESAIAAGGYLGVYQLQAEDGTIVYIGCAGGRSLFGLRGELEREFERRGPGYRVRYEVNMQYLTRMQELLMAHVADHGGVPHDNQPMRIPLGRLQPA